MKMLDPVRRGNAYAIQTNYKGPIQNAIWSVRSIRSRFAW